MQSVSDRAKSLSAKIRFVNLCEPADYMLPSAFIQEMKKSRVCAANVTAALP